MSETKKSPLQIFRSKYIPKMPQILSGHVKITKGANTESVADQTEIKALFPNTYGLPVVTFEPDNQPQNYPIINVGVVLSGGQAPGGHNVITGLFDALKKYNPDNNLYGFLGGPQGMVDNKTLNLTAEIIDQYRNTGGFDIIGSGRTKLETDEQFNDVIKTCKTLCISAIVIIGGDDSNTNACILAEYFLSKKAKIQVIGVPKTIDGDLKNEVVETSFGFDTACKVYSELIGNIQRDANSAKKYYHFIKLMGRSASHITLECALLTQPNITIISEEVEAKNMTLDDVVSYITDIVIRRAKNGDTFGTVLVPEGLVEFIPEMKQLIAELNDLMVIHNQTIDAMESNRDRREFIAERLGDDMSILFTSLPNNFSNQLLLDRDPHGNVQVSLIDTEKLLGDMVKTKLKKLRKNGVIDVKMSGQFHFFGYEGRCAVPSNFDANYCYTLGYTASHLILEGITGYIVSVKNLVENPTKWVPGGVPLTMMMNLEKRNGKMKPVIQKALVELDGNPFKKLQEMREQWAMTTDYIYPGPIQYFGPSEVCDTTTQTLKLEHI